MKSKASGILTLLAILWPASFLPGHLHAVENPSSQYSIPINQVTVKNNSLEVETDQTVFLTDLDNASRIFVVKPELASSSLISNKEVSITGIKVGTTFIHITDNDKIITLRVTVKYRGFRETQDIQQKIISQANRGESLKYTYSYDLLKTNSQSKYVTNAWKTQDQIHKYAITGDTPYGHITGDYQYDYRKNQAGLANDVLQTDFAFNNDYYTVSGGDMFTSFSDLTLPLTHIQGLRFNSGPASKHLKYDLITGSTGYYLWGKKISGFGQLKNSFYGLRGEVSPQDDLSVFLTYMSTWNKQGTDGASHDLGSFEVRYKILDYMYFDIEAATNNDKRTALQSSVKLNISKFSVTSTYRDIAVDYLNVTGNTSYRGRRGIYNNAKFNPYKTLSFVANMDFYQDRLNPDPDNVGKENMDTYFSGMFTYPKTGTSLTASYYYRDDRGQALPVVTSGQSYEIEQGFKKVYILGDVTAYLRYKPSTYKSFLTGESNYSNKSLVFGGRFSPAKGMNIMVQETVNYRQWPVLDYSTYPRRFETRFSYGSQIGKSPMYMSLYVGGQIDSHVNEDKIADLLGEDKLIGGGELKCDISNYLSAYFNVNMEKTWGSDDPTLERFQTDIMTGVKVLWDSGIYWSGYGTVKGFVFKDKNRNGIMDADDLPMPGIKISVGKDKYMFTNSRGFYRIKYVPIGSGSVMIDMSTIPKDYTLTSPLSVSFDMQKMSVERADFGVVPKTVVKGFIYNDLNRNKQFDESIDEPLPNILVRLDEKGQKTFTDLYGYFVMRNIDVGEHTISVEPYTLPKDLLLDGPISKQVSVVEGGTENVQYVFYSLRVIAGRVFIDKNANGRFDENEGVEGINVNCGSFSTTTDKSGYYIFRNLPAGKVNIAVDKTTLPQGYEVKKEPLEIELKKGTDVKENNNIEIIRKP